MSIWRLNYAAHDAYVDPARAKAQVWRIPFGIVLVAAFFLTLSQMVFGTVLNLMGPEFASEIESDGPLGEKPGTVLIFLMQSCVARSLLTACPGISSQGATHAISLDGAMRTASCSVTCSDSCAANRSCMGSSLLTTPSPTNQQRISSIPLSDR